MRRIVVTMSVLARCCTVFLVLFYVECVQITTKLGELKGQIERSRNGREFYAFYGIPYAKPPVGELRFESPEPVEPWNGVRDGTILPPPCIYSDDRDTAGEEDCLYLNLYTPKLSKEPKLPVMVFAYGGRFLFGHALPDRYGPHYFMDRDVILITFHYRVAALGFITTEDDVLPGNYGLKDFAALLRWVRDNIDSFGGDNSRVTIFGGSSGGQMTSAALVSPLTKNLFHRCISQSAYIFDQLKPNIRRKEAWEFASTVGCAHENITTSEQMKSCLKKIPALDLVKSGIKLFYEKLLPRTLFSPVIESENVADAFLVDEPEKLLSRNTDIPWLLGLVSGEGIMLTLFTYYSNAPVFRHLAVKLKEDYRKNFPDVFVYRNIVADESTLPQATELIIKEYFGDVDNFVTPRPKEFSKLFTDIAAISLKTVLDLYKGSKYVYYYDHRNKESFANMYGNPPYDLGVSHGDELVSMFNWSSAITPVTEGIDLVVSEQVLDLWTNFATHGNPNGKGEETWKPTRSPSIDYLHIKNGHLTMKSDLTDVTNYDFWKRVLSMTNNR